MMGRRRGRGVQTPVPPIPPTAQPTQSQSAYCRRAEIIRRYLSFQKAEVVYDITFLFAHKYLAKGDRTIDQMIQSARSGKQNILEGSKAAQTSKEMEIKLTNVGRASLGTAGRLP